MSRSRLSLSIVLAVVTLVSLVPMLVWDAAPDLFPAGAHRVLAAVPLTLIAVACLVYQGARGAGADFAKAALSALAFVLWALNQLLPDHPWATLFNDFAVAAFVLDVVLVIVGWPPAGQPEAQYAERRTLDGAAVGAEKAR
jgi:hypothetical protein